MPSFQVIYQVGYEIIKGIKKNIGKDAVKQEECINIHTIYTYMYNEEIFQFFQMLKLQCEFFFL
jgi:hypothetical protein